MILTPRGITIYLPLDYSFALIARLYPKVDAFAVLEKAQGIYRTHSAASFITGIICFSLGLSPLQITIWTFGITLLSYLMRLFGIFVIPGQVIIPTIYSRFTGFGLVTLITLVIGLWRVGIRGTVAFIIAKLAVEALTILIEKIAGAKLGTKLGAEPVLATAGAMYYTPALDFINAYKLYARKLGVPSNVGVSREELRKENWIQVWDDFANKWPQIVARFPKEEDSP